MDFSQTRLKLRVAVCPYVAPVGPEYHHRIVGMKRDSGSNVSLVILRQFLLLLPLDFTFADLTTLVTAQYDKLYRSQPAYVPIKSIALFRDSNQCDLDLDYLVADICASNDLIYAMVEIEESNKKIKISADKIVPENSKNQAENTITSNQGKIQNEKKVPEFKPTPIKVPATGKQATVKTETKNVTDSKPIEIAKPSVKSTESAESKTVEIKTAEKVPEVKVPAVVKAHEPKVAVPIKVVEPKAATPFKESEAKISKAPEVKTATPIKAPEVRVPTPIAKPTAIAASEPVPAKTPAAKKNPKQVEEVKNEAIKIFTESLSEPVVKTEVSMVKADGPVVNEPIITEPTVSAPAVSAPVETSINSATTNLTSYSDAVMTGNDKRTMITPIPTPISRPIFHPRKSEIPPMSSSSDEEEDNSVLNTFDATNLFGSQVITSEPRRSDAFVLFAAGSSEDSSDDSSGDAVNFVDIPDVPLKSSSIVSLQAGPSSELCEEEEDSESEEEESNEAQLPHSVTLRRLSSISPIPDPSEIPSLSELRQSINRAPTPIQMVQQQQQQKQQQQQQAAKNIGGRPASKKLNKGRPKKLQNQQQQK